MSVAWKKIQIKVGQSLAGMNNHGFGLVFIDDATFEENLAVLTDDPDCRKCERFLREIGLKSSIQLGCGVTLQFRGMCDETDEC